MTWSLHRTFGITATVIVLVAVVWGLAIAGLPAGERLRRFDDRKVIDLQTISSSLHEQVYAGQPWIPDKEKGIPKALPKDLQTVAENVTYQRLTLNDPQTGEPYVYSVVNKTTYELCAEFNDVRDQPYEVFWNHPAGRHCYRIDVLEPHR